MSRREQTQVSISGQHTGRAVGSVHLLWSMLIAEPQRQPGPIRPLLVFEIAQSGFDETDFGWVIELHRPKSWLAPSCFPEMGSEGTQGMRRQISATPVEWQVTPTAAKCGHSAVSVLQIQQPAPSCGRCFRTESLDGQKRS